MSTPLTGQIVAAFGRQYLIKLPDGEALACVTRGKKSDAVCGDRVEVMRTAAASAATGAQGVIERILPRTSLLHRSDAFKEKLIAANVTQIVIVVASEPSFSDELLARCLIAAEDQDLDVLIVLNKCDLTEPAAAARTRLEPYRTIGYRVLELTARDSAEPLRPLLQGHQSVLVGQSGMGKSTLINALLPDAQAATREISTALDSGKHTTTHAKLYRLDATSTLIDCPGVQAFGLHHLDINALAAGFPEFAPYRDQCRFYNCRHQTEPGCALTEAARQGKIDTRRMQLFQSISGKHN
ncbi:MAG: ribosome small subunit-dependent GTPase A [Nitrosomonadales bacterium]|nr:ribosome small subunit-dependent GTPase A [Nitrosomonadales bacterium]